MLFVYCVDYGKKELAENVFYITKYYDYNIAFTQKKHGAVLINI